MVEEPSSHPLRIEGECVGQSHSGIAGNTIPPPQCPTQGASRMGQALLGVCLAGFGGLPSRVYRLRVASASCSGTLFAL